MNEIAPVIVFGLWGSVGVGLVPLEEISFARPLQFSLKEYI